MLSYYCTSQCLAADELESASVSETSSSSVQIVNDNCVMPSYAFWQLENNQLAAVDDEIITDGSNDSEADDSEGGMCARLQQTALGSSSQQQQRPFGFCGTMNGRSITANGGLAYHQLPAAC